MNCRKVVDVVMSPESGMDHYVYCGLETTGNSQLCSKHLGKDVVSTDKRPLSCDCYSGCWGEHSESWHRIGDKTNARYLWAAAHKVLVYGTYVLMEDHLRILHPEDERKITEFLEKNPIGSV